MTPRSYSSGDLLADRRFAYARQLAADDPAAAADLLLQTVQLVPDWVPIWMALGEMQARLGRRVEAESAFARAETLDPDGRFGARLHLARLRGTTTIALQPSYVAALFDDYAPRFERHLTEELGYCGPALIVAALDRAADGRRFEAAVDLGCGTGLMGRAIRNRVAHIIGIDLSPAMLAQAAATGLYDRLDLADIGAATQALVPGACDLVTAADVLVYVGVLDGLFCNIGRALAPGGLLAFTVQTGESDAVGLGPDLRFAHSSAGIDAALRRAGLQPVTIEAASTRRDGGRDVPGLVVVVRKP